MKYVWPASSWENATVSIVNLGAPEPSTEPDQFERGVSFLRERGMKVSVSPSTLCADGLLSADVQTLVNEFHSAFKSPQISAVFLAAGGYNANLLLRHLDYDLIKANPKAVVGMSNMTVLLNAITAHTGLVTFHGPSVLWNLGADDNHPYTEQHLKSALSSGGSAWTVEKEESWAWLRGGSLNGRLFGGNLWTLRHLVGTSHAPDLKGCVLFLEECFAELHDIAASIQHLNDAGWLDGLSGMILGICEGCTESELGVTSTVEELVLDLLADTSFPILSGVRLGHTDEKITLPIGGFAEVSASMEFVCRRA